MSNSLRPHELQHARPPCPSPTPGVHSDSRPSSWWCHPAISSCCPLLLLPPIPPSIRVFSNESALHMRWPKYCLQLWQNIRCIPHVVQYILVACLAHNSLYLPLPTLRVPLSSHHWEPLICSLYLWVCFFLVLCEYSLLYFAVFSYIPHISDIKNV